MKTPSSHTVPFNVVLLISLLVFGAQSLLAGHRHQAASPAGYGSVGRGTAGYGYGTPGRGTPGVGTPGVGTPGVGTPGRGTPGVGAPGRGTPGIGAPGAGAAPGPRYTHARPANYERRAYNNRYYYYWDDTYYYEYDDDGPAIYVPAPVVDGVPTVPLRPYIYTLPAGYRIETVGGAQYYYYYGNPGFYYYAYYINGRAVYVLVTIVDGLPTVPPQPY